MASAARQPSEDAAGRRGSTASLAGTAAAATPAGAAGTSSLSKHDSSTAWANDAEARAQAEAANRPPMTKTLSDSISSWGSSLSALVASPPQGGAAPLPPASGPKPLALVNASSGGDKPPLPGAAAPGAVEAEVGKPVPAPGAATSDKQSSGMITTKATTEEPVSVGEFRAL
jgi:hypothetical protein